MQIVAIDLVWGGTRNHLADLVTAANVSGSKTILNYVHALLANFAEYASFALFAGVTLWFSRSITDFLFYGFCAGAGLALLAQNYQDHGIVTLLAGAAVAAERLARSWREGLPAPLDAVTRGGWFVALLLMLPVGLASGAALALHAGLAATGAGTPLDLSNAQGLRVAQTINRWDYRLYRDYADTLEEGGKLLDSLETPASRVLVADFASPFSSLLGIEPPTSGTAWMHDGRNFDESFHFPPDKMLQGIEVVMIPKRPIARTTTELMEEIYGDYLEENFEETRSTEEWRLLQRREPPRVAHTPEPRLIRASATESGPDRR